MPQAHLVSAREKVKEWYDDSICETFHSGGHGLGEHARSHIFHLASHESGDDWPEYAFIQFLQRTMVYRFLCNIKAVS